MPVLTAAECDGVLLDYESLLKAGSMLGSGGMIVLDDTTNMPRRLSVIADFYAHESCGQCTPCREGTGWAAKILQEYRSGEGQDVRRRSASEDCGYDGREDDLSAGGCGRNADQELCH